MTRLHGHHYVYWRSCLLWSAQHTYALLAVVRTAQPQTVSKFPLSALPAGLHASGRPSVPVMDLSVAAPIGVLYSIVSSVLGLTRHWHCSIRSSTSTSTVQGTVFSSGVVAFVPVTGTGTGTEWWCLVLCEWSSVSPLPTHERKSRHEDC